MNKLLFLLSVFFFISCTNTPTSNNEKITEESIKPVIEKYDRNPLRTAIKLETTDGVLILELFNETPKHRDNFISLVKKGFYDSLLFHRVINTFMIQAGDPVSKTAKENQNLGEGGPGYNIPAEIIDTFYHIRGALSAARLPDHINPKRESSGSQFYIVQGKKFDNNEQLEFEAQSGKILNNVQKELYKNIGGTPHLDKDYTIFGRLIEGYDILDKIASVPTYPNQSPCPNRPMVDVRILKATILQ